MRASSAWRSSVGHPRFFSGFEPGGFARRIGGLLLSRQAGLLGRTLFGKARLFGGAQFGGYARFFNGFEPGGFARCIGGLLLSGLTRFLGRALFGKARFLGGAQFRGDPGFFDRPEPGCLALLRGGLLFRGDALFFGSRKRFPLGRDALFFSSLERLLGCALLGRLTRLFNGALLGCARFGDLRERCSRRTRILIEQQRAREIFFNGALLRALVRYDRLRVIDQGLRFPGHGGGFRQGRLDAARPAERLVKFGWRC